MSASEMTAVVQEALPIPRLRKWCVLAAAGFSLAAVGTAAARADDGAATAPPNIVLIVLDDVGYSDFGSFGSEIRTPHIDALARDGLRYRDFNTKAVCSPTRASLLTGRNPQTVRMPDLPAKVVDASDLTRDRGEIPANAQFLPQVLRRVGYRTYGFGKWHLAPEDEDGSEGRNGSWPLQRGFDQFYGFFLGWTDQYHPKLIDGNQRIARSPDAPGYHFSVDITDRAITALAPAKAGEAQRPAFVYLAYGAGHSPIQVPRAYADAYSGTYAIGWDRLREERLARMKAMGIVPPGTVLPPRNPGDREWDSLSATEKSVFARFMEVYAGFITHTDEQIGRLVNYLKITGQYDNTIIIVVSDNGAASEAGQTGYFERLYHPNTLTPEEMAARIDELGTDKTQAEYPRPWAMAGVTPFKRYKLWPQAGGVRTPMVLSWPRRIDMRHRGAIRTQMVDAVDIAPTLADAAHTAFPATVDGRAEIPLAGASILSTFGDPDARTREVQYFELRGNRAITSGKWRAYAIHRRDTDFDTDVWELYDTSTDFSETRDLAKINPEKLSELKALWWDEARKYSDPPLAEAPVQFRFRELFDDSAERRPLRPDGTPLDLENKQ